MTIDRITSLADLEFKGKTNIYYKQLARLGLSRGLGYDLLMYDTHEKVMSKLQKVSVEYNPCSCGAVIDIINGYFDRIVEEIPPAPVKPSKPAKIKKVKDYRPTIDNLNKYKTVKLKRHRSDRELTAIRNYYRNRRG